MKVYVAFEAWFEERRIIGVFRERAPAEAASSDANSKISELSRGPEPDVEEHELRG